MRCDGPSKEVEWSVFKESRVTVAGNKFLIFTGREMGGPNREGSDWVGNNPTTKKMPRSFP